MKYSIFALLLMLFLPVLIDGQAENEIIENAITETIAHCANLESNSVCYGHDNIEAVVNCEDAPAFERAGDQLPLEVVCQLQLSPLQADGTWGLALMKVRPQDVAEDITIVSFGDVLLQNAASDFVQLEAQVLVDTDVYSGPALQYEKIGQLQAGDKIQTIACNCTKHWLRVILAEDQIGWILARNVELSGDIDELPTNKPESPVYESMQAFTLRSGFQEMDGILIQTALNSPPMPLKINNVEMMLQGTVFVQSQTSLTLSVLDGTATLATPQLNAGIPAGIRANIPLSETNEVIGVMEMEAYDSQAVALLPLELLPQVINPTASLDEQTPRIVGVEPCQVISNKGEMACSLHFVNLDGDDITQMTVEFVYSALGEWTGSIQDMPDLLWGDQTAGILAWKTSCSLGKENFIGPVMWSITLTDATGHQSEPYEASFNCVEG